MLAEFLSRYKTVLSLVFTISFSLISMVYQSNIIAIGLNNSGRVLDFFTQTFHSLGKSISQTLDSYAKYQSLKEERDALREKLKANNDVIFLINDLKRENKKYRELLNFPARQDYPVVLAEIISQNPDNWFRTIIINKGSADGIEPYMPVVAYQAVLSSQLSDLNKSLSVSQPLSLEMSDGSDINKRFLYGVVGKIIQVNPHSSRVLPLFDQYSRIGVFMEKSGHWAQLIGQSPQYPNPRVDFVSSSIFLEKGDTLVTSGGDGVFPRGIPVGSVKGDIVRMGSFQKATIEPTLDIARLHTVLVIQKKALQPQKDFAPVVPQGDE